MGEARLEDRGSGLAPAGEGWFVVNVRDAQWLTSEGGEKRASGSECPFESGEAYVDFEPSRRERPSYWDRLPWAQ